MRLKKALIIIDIQKDFCPRGALPVKEGDAIIPVVNRYIKAFAKKKLPIFVVRDIHPKETKHFKAYGGLLPPHCIEGTKGAEFHPGLKVPKEAIIMTKGMDAEKSSFSAFHAHDPNGMELLNLLKILGVNEVYVGGFTTDFGVRFSGIDALRHGFKVFLLVDAVKGYNIDPNDSEKAIAEMVNLGARKMVFEKLPKSVR